MRVTVKLKETVGSFGENKDLAKKIRLKTILPNIAKNNEVALDFSGMTGATQSFIHALIAEPIMKCRDQAFRNLFYQNTNPDIAEIISIVYRYLQESFLDAE